MSPEYDQDDATRLAAQPRDAYLGSLLDGRYLIEKELGRGGIGVVYLARDKQLYSKPVVVKILLDASNRNPYFKKKFLQEIEALARLDHLGIVGVLDSGETADGKPYLVMQFVEGVSLGKVMKAGVMSFPRVASIMEQVCDALNSAHDKKVYHRDLKPENIMLQPLDDGQDHVKIIDFGIARVEDSLAASANDPTVVAGTVDYMAPEQLSGISSAASDVFTLGVIAYEMVTGERPFHPRTPYQLVELHKAGVSVRPCQLRADLPEAAEDVILKALSFEPENRYARACDFGDALASALITGQAPHTGTYSHTAPLRLVIAYKRHCQPDEDVMRMLEQHLTAKGNTVFIDRHIKIGMQWAQEIERQVRSADAIIVLLSGASIASEMLAYEVQLAHEAAQAQQGKPRLLPVRVAYNGPLPESLGTILNSIQYAAWNSGDDDQWLAEKLLASLHSAPAPEPPGVPETTVPAGGAYPSELVGGAVPLDSPYYIQRSTDEPFYAAIERADSIVLVRGARQMGKTSLLARGLDRARKLGTKVVLTDFQKLNNTQLESIDTLFQTLGEWIADQLDLDVLPDQVWNPRRGPSTNFERYIRREVLEKISYPLVWGMDEVDRLFTCNYASEIFGLFRSWHNERALDPTGPWRRLTLAIAYATEAHLFITDLNQSPFNVGTRLVLEDFTFEQVMELNRRHGFPLSGKAEVSRYFRLVGGHPYLVRRGLNEMATKNVKLSEFEDEADGGEGPYGDHLRRLLVLLAQDAALCDAVREVLQGRPCPTSESFYRLRSAGVLSGQSRQDAKLRCQLYANYLERHLL